jgi:hypothetical protein
MNPDDIILWEDGFWCFREELHPRMGRSDDYRVVPQLTAEWLSLTNEQFRPPLPR